jgi:hypothetical protein
MANVIAPAIEAFEYQLPLHQKNPTANPSEYCVVIARTNKVVRHGDLIPSNFKIDIGAYQSQTRHPGCRFTTPSYFKSLN